MGIERGGVEWRMSEGERVYRNDDNFIDEKNEKKQSRQLIIDMFLVVIKRNYDWHFLSDTILFMEVNYHGAK